MSRHHGLMPPPAKEPPPLRLSPVPPSNITAGALPSQKRTLRQLLMSALPPKADIEWDLPRFRSIATKHLHHSSV
jgi:hypothetical protein